MVVLLPLWMKIKILSKIFRAASSALALSCNSGSSAAASAWTQPGCIPGINVRGDTAFLLLCRGYKRRSRWDTRSGSFLAALGWLFIFISKPSTSADMTHLDERRLCGAVRSLPTPLLALLYVLWDASSSDLRGGSSGVSQMNAFSMFVVLIKKVCVCVGKRSRGDFRRSGFTTSSLLGSSRSRSPFCDGSAVAAGRWCWRSRKKQIHTSVCFFWRGSFCSDSKGVCLTHI